MACESSSGKIVLGKCCGGVVYEFAPHKIIRVILDYDSGTPEDNQAWVADRLNDEDIDTIDVGQIRIITYPDKVSGPSSDDVFGIGNQLFANSRAQLWELSLGSGIWRVESDRYKVFPWVSQNACERIQELRNFTPDGIYTESREACRNMDLSVPVEYLNQVDTTLDPGFRARRRNIFHYWFGNAPQGDPLPQDACCPSGAP